MPGLAADGSSADSYEPNPALSDAHSESGWSPIATWADVPSPSADAWPFAYQPSSIEPIPNLFQFPNYGMAAGEPTGFSMDPIDYVPNYSPFGSVAEAADPKAVTPPKSYRKAVGFGLNFAEQMPEFVAGPTWNEAPGCCSRDCSLKPKLSLTPFKATRRIVRRGDQYYQTFGTDCVPMPKNAMRGLPVRRYDANGLPMGKTNPFRRLSVREQNMECAFCKNMGKDSDSYKSHQLKDRQNIITCPVLRTIKCPICKCEGGDQAHTVRYCPMKRQLLAEQFHRNKENVRKNADEDGTKTNQ